MNPFTRIRRKKWRKSRVTVLGNLLNIREPYGAVVKKCELLNVE